MKDHMCELDDSCECAVAVTNTYRHLRRRGFSDLDAYDIAARVYRLRHPKTSEFEARINIAGWVEDLQSEL
jgi:hypothetical protein